MNKIRIYVATHKEYNMPKDSIYIPLHVGAEGKKDLGYLKDNIGDNISLKNSSFCELTGIYWMWKNDNDSDYIGLNHYRRYFSLKKNAKGYDDILTEEQILNIFKEKKIIIPMVHFRKNVKDQYASIHNVDDLMLTGKIISELYPDYVDDFNQVLSSKDFAICNMFIMKKTDFDKYAEWLFNILFELEKRVDISSYDNYNKRLFGFLSERLFNVYVHHNFEKSEIKNINIYETEKVSLLKRVFSRLKRK